MSKRDIDSIKMKFRRLAAIEKLTGRVSCTDCTDSVRWTKHIVRDVVVPANMTKVGI